MKTVPASSLSLAMCIMLPAAWAEASPPPPPPPYVWDAGTLLADASIKDQARIAGFFAEDVSASVNGQPVASGKAAWLRWWSEGRSHYYGRTLGYSEGWTGAGALLVFDIYDTEDFAADPPPPGDPRPSTRSTLYLFGADHLIHSVQIADVHAFMMKPDR